VAARRYGRGHPRRYSQRAVTGAVANPDHSYRITSRVGDAPRADRRLGDRLRCQLDVAATRMILRVRLDKGSRLDTPRRRPRSGAEGAHHPHVKPNGEFASQPAFQLAEPTTSRERARPLTSTCSHDVRHQRARKKILRARSAHAENQSIGGLEWKAGLTRENGWSGRRESNPHDQLGRLELYH
jgi:hypothetical protein